MTKNKKTFSLNDIFLYFMSYRSKSQILDEKIVFLTNASNISFSKPLSLTALRNIEFQNFCVASIKFKMNLKRTHIINFFEM